MVYRHGGYAAVEVGDDIVKHREDIARQLPKKNYQRIYEPACGGVTMLAAAGRVFPGAELIGSDVSPTLLKNGHAVAEKMGVKVQFKQRDARHTGEPDNSMDAIVMHAVLHEMPVPVSIQVFKECYRILKPGGDIVISDPPPFFSVSPFQSVLLDWETANRGEPFFSDACSAVWGDELRKVGFVNVESYGIGRNSYPWINRAVKPE